MMKRGGEKDGPSHKGKDGEKDKDEEEDDD